MLLKELIPSSSHSASVCKTSLWFEILTNVLLRRVTDQILQKVDGEYVSSIYCPVQFFVSNDLDYEWIMKHWRCIVSV